MKFNHLYNLLTGKLKVANPAKLTWSNIRAVLQATQRKSMQMAGFDLGQHIWEQIIWRRIQVMERSPECWKQGFCKVCGCELIGKTMEDRPCESETPCYPMMMNAEAWGKYKKSNNIQLFD
jgi:hypothetical protein